MKVRRPRSLARWLSYSLGLQTFIGLGVVCLVVYVATRANVYARQEVELRHKQEVVAHLVREVAGQTDLASLRHKLDDFFVGHSDLSLRLTDGADVVLYATSTSLGPQAEARQSTLYVPSAWPQITQLRAEMTLDTSSDADLLQRLAWTLLASAITGAAIVSVGGAWLVRRALAPVTDLARQAADLAPQTVGQSLDGSAQAEELQPLVVQFNALLARLESAYEQLEGFNADVAHELRTPLATLIGETELALTRKRSIDELQQVLASNLEDLHRLSGLVNDMLFLSKADRGEQARREPIASLAALAGEVIEFHDASLYEACVEVRVVGDAAGSFDAPLLRRALSNLLANATRFARRGSTIELEITTEPGGHVRIGVGNHGHTIAAAHLPHLFDRFFRVDRAREHGDTNHGLGLSIVAAIARMHGGDTFARSSAGWTTVGFSLSPKNAPE